MVMKLNYSLFIRSMHSLSSHTSQQTHENHVSYNRSVLFALLLLIQDMSAAEWNAASLHGSKTSRTRAVPRARRLILVAGTNAPSVKATKSSKQPRHELQLQVFM